MKNKYVYTIEEFTWDDNELILIASSIEKAISFLKKYNFYNFNNYTIKVTKFKIDTSKELKSCYLRFEQRKQIKEILQKFKKEKDNE